MPTETGKAIELENNLMMEVRGFWMFWLVSIGKGGVLIGVGSSLLGVGWVWLC